MVSLAPVLGFSVLGIPSGDTQNTSDLGTGVPKTRGYPNHCGGKIRTPARKCKQQSLQNEVFLKFMGNLSKISLHSSLENSNNDYRYDNGVDQFQFLLMRTIFDVETAMLKSDHN